MRDDVRAALSHLPQVDGVLRRADAAAAIAEHGRRAFTTALRAELDIARMRILGGEDPPTDAELVAASADRLARRRAERLASVINATGVVLHTNLGRAPLSTAAQRAVLEASGYTNLELDLTTGRRGSRTAHLGALAAELCGTEAATVVNNGAAALMLVLAALAAGREVVVSRGELIEIGGSYRLPQVMEAAGAVLVEVGTTNRTHLDDYRAAIGEDTALLLKVHRSNYRVIGFTSEVSPDELAALARGEGVPLVHDLGSGLIRDTRTGPLATEPSVDASVRAGVDLLVFSGDKLLGGPQAGIIAGRGELVSRCTGHPLARAVRVDKLQRAALEATLEAHLRDDPPLDVPVSAMLHTDLDTLRARAHRAAERLGGGTTAVEVEGAVGGGALPGIPLASWAVALPDHDPNGLAKRLRDSEPPVIARVEDDRVLLDLRTVPPSEDDELIDLVRRASG